MSWDQLFNKEIQHTFSDQEIEVLIANRAKIDADIEKLKVDLDDQNPNVQILALFKQRKTEHDNKLTNLRSIQT